MDLLRREALNEQVQRFGIHMSDRMLQHAISAIGITPIYEGVPGGKGKISWFDPIDAWVIATAEFGRDGAWSDASVRLDGAVDLYEHARKVEKAASIPGFLESPDLGAKLMYITRWRGGFPLQKLVECLMADSNLYELSAFEPRYLRLVLMQYKVVLGSMWAGLPLPAPENLDFIDPWDADSLARHFAEQVVEAVGGVFEM